MSSPLPTSVPTSSSAAATTTSTSPATAAPEPTTVRLVALPNSSKGLGAVTDLFPLLAPAQSNASTSGLLVPAVCHVKPDGGLAAGSSCPLPSAPVWESLTACIRAKCNPRIGSDDSSRDDIAEIATEECAMRECLDQFVAATANLCLPLSAPVLKDAQVFLPRLPPSASNDTTWTALHAKHLESVGQTPPAATTPGTASPAPEGSLGICVTTVPVGTVCDVANDIVATSGQPVPWVFPAPVNVPSRPPERGQPLYPKAMLAYLRPPDPSASSPLHSTDQVFVFTPAQLRPPALLRYLPTESGRALGTPSPDQPNQEKARVLGSANFYTLTYCDPKSQKYQATLAPNAFGCTYNTQCRHSFSCARGGQCAPSPPVSWAPPTYLGNDADTWLADERRARVSQFTLQLVVVGVLCFAWCMHVCHARLFRLWVHVNRKVKGTSTTTQRELALQPASNLMLEDLSDGVGRDGRRARRGMVDEELGVVVMDGPDALPQYQPPGAAGHTLERDDGRRPDAGHVVLSAPPPAFTSVAPGASGPATLGESLDASAARSSTFQAADHGEPQIAQSAESEPTVAQEEEQDGQGDQGPLPAGQASPRPDATTNANPLA